VARRLSADGPNDYLLKVTPRGEVDELEVVNATRAAARDCGGACELFEWTEPWVKLMVRGKFAPSDKSWIMQAGRLVEDM
jgi:hypothetical protein